MNPRTTGLLLILAVIAVGLVALRTPPMDPERECCDHLYYRAMAGGPTEIPEGNRLTSVFADPYHSGYLQVANGLTRQPPYCYRVLAPLVSRAIGWSALTLACLILTAWLVAICALELTGRVLAGALASVLFALNPWTVSFPFYDYILVDPLAYLAIALGLLLLIRRSPAFWPVVAVGLFAKETVGLLLLCWLLAELLERRLRVRSLSYAFAAALPYLAFRLALPVPANTYSLATAFVPWPRPGFGLSAWAAFGLLWLPLPLGVWRCRRLLSLFPLLAGSLATALFAVNVERCLSYAFPLLILSAVVVLRASSTQRGSPSSCHPRVCG